MPDKNGIIEFFREHWKFWFSILLCIAFFAIGSIIYMHYEEKRVESPKIVKYEDSTNPDTLSKTIRVDSGTAREITREIERIHDGNTQPVVTYTVESPDLETAATETAKSIEQKDPSLPKQAVEKTDRTVITPDPNKQTVDVYKINLRNNHKIKVGVLQVDGKTYGGVGYQAGRWEGIAYTRNGKQIEAGSIMYTIKQW
jgi:ABC-type Na+ efflux pump permease subunit